MRKFFLNLLVLTYIILHGVTLAEPKTHTREIKTRPVALPEEANQNCCICEHWDNSQCETATNKNNCTITSDCLWQESRHRCLGRFKDLCLNWTKSPAQANFCQKSEVKSERNIPLFLKDASMCKNVRYIRFGHSNSEEYLDKYMDRIYEIATGIKNSKLIDTRFHGCNTFANFPDAHKRLSKLSMYLKEDQVVIASADQCYACPGFCETPIEMTLTKKGISSEKLPRCEEGANCYKEDHGKKILCAIYKGKDITETATALCCYKSDEAKFYINQKECTGR